MKKGMLFLLLLGAFGANTQSLKDALYGGKLKMDSNSVIRKTDDLSSKIDTAAKKKTEPEKPKTPVQVTDATKPAGVIDSASGAVVTTDASSATTDNAVSAKNNTKIWKEYIDAVTGILKTEVLPQKKIKKDTYYLYVEYEIGADGKVEILNVVATPENSFLADSVKSHLILNSPQLAPALDSNGKPRKVKRKYNFNITKE